jgi:hypothetical protein
VSENGGVTWAEDHNRFTLLLGSFAIEVLQASQSILPARCRGVSTGQHYRSTSSRLSRAGLIDAHSTGSGTFGSADRGEGKVRIMSP